MRCDLVYVKLVRLFSKMFYFMKIIVDVKRAALTTSHIRHVARGPSAFASPKFSGGLF